ncbi:protein translocase subunit SecF [Thermodesulforhabdus norvegica]|uniref:Protein-export membrane protein SecF n=1 Tax=Thermodesulforhabdus norvegica TaxID=39841 RepID=A0A1I4UVJ8_9BACT|nr:protein translocase subunit SecF [Thermodesulforhabdus norvegica]SFM93014.1 protein translocase subunit secF [Thermodesulforhabdus norvegica]
MEFIRPDINLDFVGRRNIAFVLSIVLIVTGLSAMVIRGGLNMGIDFAGGTIVQVKFSEPVEVSQIREALKPLGVGGSAIQQVGLPGDNEFLIRTGVSGDGVNRFARQVKEKLEGAFGAGKVEIRRVETVGPKVGEDLRHKALLAIYYSLLFIAIYISGRFEFKWLVSGGIAAALLVVLKLLEAVGLNYTYLTIGALILTLLLFWIFRLPYALAAILALIHDVLITVGIFAIFNKEFTLQIVAALLTIVGYSLNDTIIVFDRIRENLRKERVVDFKELVNRSINQTLSRTILTSGTTLVVIVALFALGGTVIRDFAFALMIGVIVGTYSSIFVASPLLIVYEEWALRKPVSGTAAARKAS